MKSKKTSQGKKETKKTQKPIAKKISKPAAKPTKKVSAPAKTAKVVSKSKPAQKVVAPITKQVKAVSKPSNGIKMPEIFKDFYKEGERIFLRAPKKFAGFPDLLDLQKRGYDDFIKKYINKLFNNINPVWDIA